MNIKNNFPDYPSDRLMPSLKRRLGHYSNFVRGNMKLALSVTLVVWTLVSAYALFAYVPKYASSAAVLIKDSAIKAQYLTDDQYSTTSSASANPVLNTMELLKSDKIAKALWRNFVQPNPNEARKLGLYNEVDWMRYYGAGKRLIQYKSVPGTDVINLTFYWSDPAMAQEGMNALLQAFIKTSQELNQSEHHERSLYLELQQDDIRRRLGAVRERISQFKKNNSTYDIKKEIENYAQNRLAIEMAYKTALADANSLKKQFSAYQGTLGMDPKQAVLASAIGRNETLAKLHEENYTLSEKYASLKARYTGEHPQVRQLASQLAANKADIEREMTRIAGKTQIPLSEVRAFADETRSGAVKEMLQTDALSQGMDLKASQMGEYLGRLESRMKQLPQMEQVLADMSEEEASLSKALDTLEQKTLEAKMREMQTLSNVFVINEASHPISPLPPTQAHIILLGLLMGLVAGLTLAFVKERYLRPFAQGDIPESDAIQANLPHWPNGHAATDHLPVLKG